jgi:hypothetical protein
LAVRAVWLRLHSSLAMKLTSKGPGWAECAWFDLRDTACCRLRPADDADGSSDRAMERMADGGPWAWDSGKAIEPICHLLRVAGDVGAEVAQLTRVGERGPGFSIGEKCVAIGVRDREGVNVCDVVDLPSVCGIAVVVGLHADRDLDLRHCCPEGH